MSSLSWLSPEQSCGMDYFLSKNGYKESKDLEKNEMKEDGRISISGKAVLVAVSEIVAKL